MDSTEPYPTEALPTERDLDRLTSAVRSAGSTREFPRRVTKRYLQWILLFVGWALKTPPHSVSRNRIGDFWAALSEHSGADMARICEAMDALGFYFGTVRRENNILSFPDEPEKPNSNHRTDRPPEDQRIRLARPNPTLRAPARTPSDETVAERKKSDHDLSDQQLSQYLPSGTLPEEPDAREEIPVREVQSEDRPAERAPTTLFDPEGLAPPPDDERTHVEDEATEPDASKAEQDDAQAPEGRRLWDDFPRSQTPDPEANTAPQQDEKSDESSESTEADADRVPVHLPKPVADRLRRAAKRLGLPPAVFAARAIEIVCEDAGIERSDESVAESPLERYQTQLDLIRLQNQQDAPSAETESSVNGGHHPAPDNGASGEPDSDESHGE